MKRAIGYSAALFLALTLLLEAIPVDAQVYPPPTNTPRRTARPGQTPRDPGPPGTDEPPFSPRPTPPRTPRATGQGDGAQDPCMGVLGEVGNDFERGRVEYRGDMIVEGDEGCAESQGDVDITIHSHPVFLGTIQAAEDGSYRGTFTLPAHIRPGDHTVIADIEGRGELRAPIEIIDETEVGGVSETNPGGGGSGVLPRTGAALLKLLLWAVVLVGLGTMLIASTWRWSQHLAPVRAVGSRLKAGGRRPSSRRGEIQRVDTSAFVPERKQLFRGRMESESSEAGTLTEWDIASRGDQPS